jgi:hypothetical protein
MVATICIGPGFLVSNLELETRFGLMGKGGHFSSRRGRLEEKVSSGKQEILRRQG